MDILNLVASIFTVSDPDSGDLGPNFKKCVVCSIFVGSGAGACQERTNNLNFWVI